MNTNLHSLDKTSSTRCNKIHLSINTQTDHLCRYSISTCPYSIIDELKELLTVTEWKILQLVERFNSKYEVTHFTREWIAKYLHISVSSVRRAIKKFRLYNIIAITKRSWTSNIYALTDRYRIKLLKTYLLNFRYALVGPNLLLSQKPHQQHNAPLIGNKENYRYYPTMDEQFKDVEILKDETNNLKEHELNVILDMMNRKPLKQRDPMYSKSFELLRENDHILPLTTHGQLKMSIFHPDIIRMLLAKKIKLDASNLFGWLYKVANEESSKANLPLGDKQASMTAIFAASAGHLPEIDPTILDTLKTQRAAELLQMPNQANFTKKEREQAASRDTTEHEVSEKQQYARYKRLEEEHEKQIDDVLRTRGFNASRLSFNQKRRVLRGESTKQQIDDELDEKDELPQVSTLRPTTQEQFMASRREVVAYFQAKLDKGKELNDFERIVFEAFRKDDLDNPVNPLFPNGPKLRDVLANLNP